MCRYKKEVKFAPLLIKNMATAIEEKMDASDYSTSEGDNKDDVSEEKEEDDGVSDHDQIPVLCGDCESCMDVTSYCLSCNIDICDKCKARKLHR